MRTDGADTAPRCLNKNAMFVASAEPNAKANPAVMGCQFPRTDGVATRRPPQQRCYRACTRLDSRPASQCQRS